MNDYPKKQTAAQKTFSAYTGYISKLVIEKYGPSYSTYEEVRNRWRNLIPYSAEIENFLIFQTKMYVRFLDSRDSNSTNPQFLESLAKLMADYLSAYSMQNPKYATRKKAKEMLKKELYDNCSYIQHLLARQAAARDAQDSNKRKTYKRPTRAKQKQSAEAAKADFKRKRILRAVQIEIKIKSR